MLTLEKVELSDSDSIKKMAELEQMIFSDPWSEQAICSTIEQECSYCVVARADEMVVGYFICYSVLDEWEIARIAVVPEIRRKGIGQSLMDAMVEACKANGIVRILLDVRESNASAISFYRKNGFIVDGMRKNFYGGEHPEHAVLMSRNLEEKIPTRSPVERTL